MSWVVHLLVAKFVLKAMNLPSSVTWAELFAYTGYAFVPVCLTILLGQLAGKWGYWAGWMYGSLCMAVFLVRTMKRIIFQEARNYSEYECRCTPAAHPGPLLPVRHAYSPRAATSTGALRH